MRVKEAVAKVNMLSDGKQGQIGLIRVVARICLPEIPTGVACGGGYTVSLSVFFSHNALRLVTMPHGRRLITRSAVRVCRWTMRLMFSYIF